MTTRYKELWAIQGPGWQVPFEVEWREDHKAEVIPAIYLLMTQRRKVFPFLEHRSDHKWQDVHVMRLEVLREIGARVTGNPEDYLIWGQAKDAAKSPERIAKEEYVGADFIEAFVEETGFLDYPRAQALWKALTSFMLTWMLERQKTVDLGFAELIPLPYRVNWKPLLHQEYPKLRMQLAGKGYEARVNYLYNLGFLERMVDPEFLAIDPTSSRVYWSIEVKYTKGWWKKNKAVEERKMEIHGSPGYAKQVQNSIKRFLEKAVTCYLQWLDQTTRPNARYTTRIEGSLAGLVPKRRKKGSGGAYPAQHAIDSVTPRETEGFNESPEEDLEEENEGVQELPDIRSDSEDVRE